MKGAHLQEKTNFSIPCPLLSFAQQFKVFKVVAKGNFQVALWGTLLGAQDKFAEVNPGSWEDWGRWRGMVD